MTFYSIKNFLYNFTCFLNNTIFNLLLVNLLLIIKNFIIINKIAYYIYYKIITISIKIKIPIISLNLLVGFNNIHPFLFYISLIFSFFSLLFLNKFLKCTIQYVYMLIVISLLLGGLWGAGNSSWGFFWLKDPIELILLLLFCLIIQFSHVNFTYNNFFLLLLMFLLLLSFLYYLRNGFIFTKHNFFNVKLRKNTIIYIIIFLTIITNINSLQFKTFVISIIIILSCYFYTFILLYFINFAKIFLNNYNNKIKLIHIFIFSLYLIWIKYRENNFSIYNYLTLKQIITSNYYWILTKVYNLLELYKFKTLLFLNYSIFYLYAYKFYFFIFINMNYIYFLIITILLISKLKIVTK